MKYYVGIDNGSSGGYAIISPSLAVYTAVLPTALVSGLRHLDVCLLREKIAENTGLDLRCPEALSKLFVIYEQGAKNPYFGTIGNFSNGYHFGVIKTFLELLQIPNTCISPRQWQKQMFMGIRNISRGNTKGAAIEVCKRLFPQVDLRRTVKCKKEHDGIADALCMAEWGRRNNL